MLTNTIIVPNPTVNGEVANKNYVDSLLSNSNFYPNTTTLNNIL